MSERYNVDSPIQHDGEQYHPETENNTIELSDKHAEPLLAAAAISVIEDETITDTKGKPEDTSSDNADQNTGDGKPATNDAENQTSNDADSPPSDKPEDKQTNVVPINNAAPEDKQQQLDDIKRAIDGLDVENEASWTKDKKADTKVLSQLLGWKVTAALRDEAAALESDK